MGKYFAASEGHRIFFKRSENIEIFIKAKKKNRENFPSSENILYKHILWP